MFFFSIFSGKHISFNATKSRGRREDCEFGDNRSCNARKKKNILRDWHNVDM